MKKESKKSSSLYKQQHFIPESYQKAWIDPASKGNKLINPYVWLGSKATGAWKNKSPNNTFKSSDFYTEINEIGERCFLGKRVGMH